ncbi:MAG: DUF86 domain-containing protein [Chloroflexi bacterium]|nr:DUF86 domain-containing protein [Chloroflexota bacterium]
MPKTLANDPTRLRHMLEWAQTSEHLAARETRISLDESLALRLALIRTLLVIGEAANNVTAESRRAYSAIPWADIIGMRHKLVHVYYAVDLNIVWTTVSEYVPPLLAELQRILEDDPR